MPEVPSEPNECERCEQELSAVLMGIADVDTERFVRLHLPNCPDCQREATELQASMNDLLYVAPVPLLPGARSAFLDRARQTPLEEPFELRDSPDIRGIKVRDVPPKVDAGAPGSHRRPLPPRWGVWVTTAIGIAAALGLLLARTSSDPDIRQADVVVSAGSSVVMARSDVSTYPLVVRTATGQLRGVKLAQAHPAWYTEGVYNAGKAYLLDAANERLVVLDVERGKVERTYPAPGGASGLAVSGRNIFVKAAASGELRRFQGNSTVVTSVAAPAPLSQGDYMDAVLVQPDRLLTTQHTSGQVIALSIDGRRIIGRYHVGGAPVGLESWKQRVLVLDVRGRLLELRPDGQVARTLGVPGHPDKFSVMGDHAYLTDRGGQVSEIDLIHFTLMQQRTFGKPMDIVALPDGHLALADATQGLIMLNSDLSEI